jgi:AraC-like DNA-binding protein
MSEAAARRLPLAALAPDVTEHLYYPSTTGHIFAAPTVASAMMQLPFYGIISLSADGDPITLTTGGRTFQCPAMAFCARDLKFAAAGTRFVSIVVNPLHKNFRAFSRLAPPFVLPLDRGIFKPFEALMNKALEGALSHEEALELFDGAQNVVMPFLPVVPKLDERAQILVKELWANPRCSVTHLAQRLGLSYHRTSHFFTEAVGVPMRTYQLWQKLYKAGGPLLAGASLTEAAHAAGFVDSAHYSSAFQKAYGRAPSEMFRSRSVAIYSTNPVCKARGARDPLSELI